MWRGTRKSQASTVCHPTRLSYINHNFKVLTLKIPETDNLSMFHLTMLSYVKVLSLKKLRIGFNRILRGLDQQAILH